MINNNQITEGGIAQQSGLEVFSSITNYTGEYVNWGFPDDVFNDNIARDTGEANPYTDSLLENPPSTVNVWYSYYTNADTIWTAATPPAVSSSLFYLYGQKSGGKASYSGMYQKLSLITGKEYQISIEKYGTANEDIEGTVIVQVYTPSAGDYLLVYDSSYSTPVTLSSESTFTDTFTAVSSNDILMISFTTDFSDSMASININRISIQEKQEYLVPVYAEDRWGNDHKVLKRNVDNANLNT
jgi:hypothetical protein